jgi:hypothetical protein
MQSQLVHTRRAAERKIFPGRAAYPLNRNSPGLTYSAREWRGSLRASTWPCGWGGWRGLICLLFLLSGGIAARAQCSVTLAWDLSPDTNVVGYRIYYGVASQVYTNFVDAGNTATNTVSGLVAGVGYFFAVKGYDRGGVESAFSNEIGFTPTAQAPRVTLALDGGGQPMVQITSPTGQSFDIYATRDFSNWVLVGTVAPGSNGWCAFCDAGATNLPARFYRVQPAAK